MSSIYKQSDRNSQNRTFERMQLISMVPLEVGDQNSNIFPPSPLEVKRECFKKTISNFTKNIDCKVNVDGLNKRPLEKLDYKSYNEITNFHSEHRKTSYEPSFTQKKLEFPGAGAYTPQYDAILPSSIKISIKDKETNRNEIQKKNFKKKKFRLKNIKNISYSTSLSSQFKENSEEYYGYDYDYDFCDENKKSNEKQFDAYSTADVISLYQTNMRDFDEKSVNYPKFEFTSDDPHTISYKIRKECLKGESLCFKTAGNRDFFDSNSLTKNIAPADPVSIKPPPVPILSRQKNRELSVLDRLKFFNETADNDNIAGNYADDGTYKHFNMHNSKVADLALSLSRNYPDAAIQLDKLKPRTPSLTSIRHQKPRFESPPKNKRVEFLEKITREQMNTMKKISKNENSKSMLQHSKVKKIVKSPTKSNSRPKSAFDLQSSRPKSLFPDLPEPFPGTKYPCDPIESYKKTIPSPKRIKISDNGNRDLTWIPS